MPIQMHEVYSGLWILLVVWGVPLGSYLAPRARRWWLQRAVRRKERTLVQWLSRED